MHTPSAPEKERFWWRAFSADFALPREQSFFQMRCAGSSRPFSAERTVWLAKVDDVLSFLAETKSASDQMENCRLAAICAVKGLKASALSTPGRPDGFLSLLFATNGGHAGLYSLTAYFAVKYLFLNAAVVRKRYPELFDRLPRWISELLDKVLKEPAASDWEDTYEESSLFFIADKFLECLEREAFDETLALLAQLRLALLPGRQIANALFDKRVVDELSASASRWIDVTKAFTESLYFLRHGERRTIRRKREREAEAAADRIGKGGRVVRIASNQKAKEGCL